MKIKTLTAAWHGFWFVPQSPLPVAFFRIALGVLILNLCLLLQPNMITLFGQRGIVSAETMNAWWKGNPELSLFAVLPASNEIVQGLFILLVASGLFLTIGLFSRSSAIVAFIILLSLDSRNHFVFHPAFALLRLMLLYLSFSPCDRAISLDNSIRRLLRKDQLCSPAPDLSGWAQRLMQLQIVAVYVSSLLFQLSATAWLDDRAVYAATHLEQLSRLPIPFLVDQLWTCKIIGWIIMLVELALCTLIWVKELRYATMLTGVFLHLGIEYSMVFIPLFQYLMIASYLLFIDADVLSRIVAGMQSGVRTCVQPFGSLPICRPRERKIHD